MADLKDIELLNQDTGAVESLSTAEASAAIAAGTHASRKGIDLPMRGSDGKMYSVPSDKVQEGINKYGMSLATPDEAKAASESAFKAGVAASKEERFGDFGGKVATGAAGLLDTATLGASNVIASKVGAKDAVRTAAEVNPGSYVAGQVLGAFAPGGIGVAGAIGKEAAVATKLSTEALTAGAQLTRKQEIASQILQRVTQGAVEGGIAGAGSAIGSTALKEGPMSREDVDNLIYSTAAGTLFGGVLGGGIEGAGTAYHSVAPKIGEAVEGISEGFRKNVASKILGNSSTRAEAEALTSLPKSAWTTSVEDANAIERGLNSELKLGNKTLDAQGKAVKAVLKADEVASRAEVKELRQTINKLLKNESDEVAESLADAVNETGDIVSGVRNIYSRGKDLAVQADQAAEASTTLPQVQEQVAALYTKLKASLPKGSKALEGIEGEAATIGNVPNLRGEFDQLRVLKQAASRATAGGNIQNATYAPIKQFREGIVALTAAHPEQEIAQLYLKSDKLFSASDDLAKALVGSKANKLKDLKPGMVNEAYAKALLEPKFGNLIEEIAKRAPELAPELQAFTASANNYKNQRAILEQVQATLKGAGVKDATLEDLRSAFNAVRPESAAIRNIDRLKAVQDKIAAIPAEQVNSANVLRDLREALGARVGAARKSSGVIDAKRLDAARRDSITKSAMGRQNEGWLYTALATTLGHPTAVALLGLKRGLAIRNDAYAQAQLYRGMRASVEAGRNLVDGAMTKVLNGLNTTPGRILATKDMLALDKYAAEADKVRAASENLHNENSVVVRNMEPYQGVPEVQQRIAEHSTNTIQFLESKLPRPTVKTENSFLPPKSTISDAEKTKFLRFMGAAQNPISVLDSVANGRVTAEQVETLQTLHPELYDKVKAGIVEKLAEPGLEIPYQRRLNLSVLFNVPGDPSLTPSQFSMLQASYAPAPDKGGRPPASNGSSTETTSKSTQSETDRLTFQ